MRAAVRRAQRRWTGRRGPVGPQSVTPARVASKAAVLRCLELDVTRRLDGYLSGDHLSTSTGPGSEPAGARPYGPGDDARRIDWNLTARSVDVQIRTAEADRELETVVVADRSASLDFGTARFEKREVVLGAAAAFGSLTVRSGNRLGFIVAGGEELVQLRPGPGRPTLLAGLSMLYDTPRRDAPPPPGADLAGALVRLERTTRRHGQIVVISDFFDRSDWARPLRRLALGHQVIAVQITDPRELVLPAVGLLSVVDVESGRHLQVQTNRESLRQAYAHAADDRDAAIHDQIVRAGADHLALSTDRDWLIDVARFVGRRRWVRRQAPEAGAGVRTGRPGVGGTS